jgi:hypothetical protein
MTKNATGVASVSIGAGLIAFNWYTYIHEARFYMVSCFLGPALTVYGIACLVLPLDKLYRKTETQIGDQTIVHYDQKSLAPLAWVFVLFGIALGGLQFAGFKMGWFL